MEYNKYGYRLRLNLNLKSLKKGLEKYIDKILTEKAENNGNI